MEYLTIKLNSVVCPVCTGSTIPELGRLCQLARQKDVEIHFWENWCRIIGYSNRKVKVPAKCTKDGATLTAWIEARIESAWK